MCTPGPAAGVFADMLRAIASFELRYHLRSPLFAIFFIVFAAMTYLLLTSDPADGFGAVNDVRVSSPYVIMQCLLMVSLFATLPATAFVVNSIHRDFELNTDTLFFSRPITKAQYMGGRFAGSFAAGLLIFAGVAIAARIAAGPIDPYTFAYSLFVLVMPNLLLIAAILFAVAALTRSLMATYAGLVVLAGLYGIAQVLSEDIEQERLAALLDPFGVRALFLATRYWTVFQKNTQVLPLEGVFLWNRIVWMGTSAVFLAIAYLGFMWTAAAKPAFSKRELRSRTPHVAMPRVRQVFNAFPQFRAIVKFELLATLKSLPFLIMLFCGICLVAANTINDGWLGTPLPVTRVMLDAIRDAFAIFALLIAAFYAGDIVWRERSARLHEVTDALPVPLWVQWSAKLTSLLIVVFLTLAAATLTTIAAQTLRGYHNYEFALYAKGILGVLGIRIALMAGLAFVLQLVFNHKLAGFIGIALIFIANLMLPKLGFDHLLYRYASLPPFAYSDMNGYGHFARPIFWMHTYWLLFLGVLLAIAYFLRTRRGAKTIAALSIAFIATGCYVFYNTNIAIPYHSRKELEALTALAEKKYKRFEGIPQPRIVAVKANVDIHPERRAVFIDGSYVATNKSGAPIGDLHITWNARRLISIDVIVPNATLKHDDRELGYRIYSLATPLAPGASLTMRFRTAWEPRGFSGNTRVVENGTFINNFDYFPHFGYSSREELKENRAEHGLPPLERMKKPTDPCALNENGRGTDWITLDTTVSTSADQIALAPGYLQRSWLANGRRHFHYKTESPILGFFAYLSARYEVKRDHWNGIPIEIYYDKKHPYNVDRMIAAVKKSLDYFTKNFGPYQHRQVRILEFPGYANFAQAFPNTIPYSETLGFVADVRDDDNLDYVFYATAHEVAHQWWGHQVVPANVQGATILTETLAQYSALMVLDREYDGAKMKRYLSWEADRYFAGRGKEILREMPLLQVERQDYIHYNKGALVMYALRDAIGEERLNRALARFLADHRFAGPPYPTALQLMRYLRAETPPESQKLLTDLFERITLFNNEAREVTVAQRDDGRYEVKVTVAATKLYSDGKGEEQPVPIDDWIDIGVLRADETPIFLEKRRITKPVETFEIVVSERPERAGIDPLNKLLDRNPRDNTKSASAATGSSTR